ncbi:hypothetical protein [Bacillus amyloliquefaciens]|uniref:hypothetical protein n=1 Tax=Bacillus amyloliquefaciens TaxID=1390 RepID=UPI002DBDD20C|nr:hypothetical protein [Bacillus amyloliquefaciens]MEC3841542.1 hypothetical protein [Bacillus amyloliquefaciens]
MSYIIKIGEYYYVKDYRFYSAIGEIAVLATDKVQEAYVWNEYTDGTVNSLAVLINGQVVPMEQKEGAE